MAKQFRGTGRSFPSMDITDSLDFPELSVDTSNLCVKPSEWNLVPSQIKDNSKVYPNGDVFEGEFDAITGRPSYGKIMYANGNVYEGPIHYSWPQDKEPNEEEEIDGGEECQNNWDCDEDGEDVLDCEDVREGIWTFPDGKVFVGVACFGKEW